MSDPNANVLTDAERAELNALRAAAQSQPPVQTPDNTVTLPPTHWLHLANGDVVTSNGVKSVHNGIQVIASYEIPPELNSTTDTHVF